MHFALFLSHPIPDAIRGITGEGMPMFRHNDLRGNLYIKFDVEFPKNSYLDEDGIKVTISCWLELMDVVQ